MCAFSIHNPLGHALEVLRYAAATAGLYPAEIERRACIDTGLAAELRMIVDDINSASAPPVAEEASSTPAHFPSRSPGAGVAAVREGEGAR